MRTSALLPRAECQGRIGDPARQELRPSRPPNHKGGSTVGKRHERQALHPTLSLKTVVAMILVVIGLLILLITLSR